MSKDRQCLIDMKQADCAELGFWMRASCARLIMTRLLEGALKPNFCGAVNYATYGCIQLSLCRLYVFFFTNVLGVVHY